MDLIIDDQVFSQKSHEHIFQARDIINFTSTYESADRIIYIYQEDVNNFWSIITPFPFFSLQT